MSTNEKLSGMTNECAACATTLPEYQRRADYPLCIVCDRACLRDAYRAAEVNMVALTKALDESRSALATAATERDVTRAEVERLRLAADMLREIPRAALSSDKVYREDWPELFTDEDGAALYLDTAVDRVLDRITRKEGK